MLKKSIKNIKHPKNSNKQKFSKLNKQTKIQAKQRSTIKFTPLSHIQEHHRK